MTVCDTGYPALDIGGAAGGDGEDGDGYQLYAADMAARCGEIRRMQGERLTLEEIGARLAQRPA